MHHLAEMPWLDPTVGVNMDFELEITDTFICVCN